LLGLGLSSRDVDVLMTIDTDIDIGYDGVLGRGAIAYFDEVSQGRSPKTVVNWYVGNGSSVLAYAGSQIIYQVNE
jgi:aspartyl-tRNA(Asn)/glutamyl-tRNA(Gln) amidotransferase subunit B